MGGPGLPRPVEELTSLELRWPPDLGALLHGPPTQTSRPLPSAGGSGKALGCSWNASSVACWQCPQGKGSERTEAAGALGQVLLRRTAPPPPALPEGPWWETGEGSLFLPLRLSAFFPLSFLAWVPLSSGGSGSEMPPVSPEGHSVPLPSPCPCSARFPLSPQQPPGTLLREFAQGSKCPCEFSQSLASEHRPPRPPQVQPGPAPFPARQGLCGGRQGAWECGSLVSGRQSQGDPSARAPSPFLPEIAEVWTGGEDAGHWDKSSPCMVRCLGQSHLRGLLRLDCCLLGSHRCQSLA